MSIGKTMGIVNKVKNGLTRGMKKKRRGKKKQSGEGGEGGEGGKGEEGGCQEGAIWKSTINKTGHATTARDVPSKAGNNFQGDSLFSN